MKKACLLLFIICLSGTSFAQTWNTYSGTFYTTAAVGIGTTAQTMFNVNGGGSVFGVNSTLNNTDGAVSLGNMGINYIPTGSNWNSTGTTLLLNDGGNSTIGFHHVGYGVDFIQCGIRTITLGYNGGYGAANVFVPASLVIGTTNTTTIPGYALAVNGAAISTSFTVQSFGNWPDYVFKPKYRLPSLTEVKTYIDQNQHLPEIPSAAQIEKDGLNLGDMDKMLVKKVEELTLYLIDKDKQLKTQQAEIDQLKQSAASDKEKQLKELDLLKQQMQQLLKQVGNKN